MSRSPAVVHSFLGKARLKKKELQGRKEGVEAKEEGIEWKERGSKREYTLIRQSEAKEVGIASKGRGNV